MLEVKTKPKMVKIQFHQRTYTPPRGGGASARIMCFNTSSQIFFCVLSRMRRLSFWIPQLCKSSYRGASPLIEKLIFEFKTGLQPVENSPTPYISQTHLVEIRKIFILDWLSNHSVFFICCLPIPFLPKISRWRRLGGNTKYEIQIQFIQQRKLAWTIHQDEQRSVPLSWPASFTSLMKHIWILR